MGSVVAVAGGALLREHQHITADLQAGCFRHSDRDSPRAWGLL